MANNFLQGFLDDLRVELFDEFDRNFERKAFFDQPWPAEKYPAHRGSLLMRSGALRRSLKATSSGKEIRFSSSVPYAGLQNDGGVLVVTPGMKKYFWAMYYKAGGAAGGSGARKARFSAEAAYWKGLALKKVGSQIKITARPFIGYHRQVDQTVERVINGHMRIIEQELYKSMQP